MASIVHSIRPNSKSHLVSRTPIVMEKLVRGNEKWIALKISNSQDLSKVKG